MSSSLNISHAGKFAGRSSGKAAEKSAFAQTCNLLSHYLKEKGTFCDLSLAMNGILEAPKGKQDTHRPAETMNLLSNMENLTGVISGHDDVSALKPMDFIPQIAGLDSSDPSEDTARNSDLSKTAKMEPETAQMTIFYAGQVLVFHEFPSGKAREIMTLAGKGSSQDSKHFNVTNTGSSSSCGFNKASAPGTNPTQEGLRRPTQAIGSDMPIARRASLQRFLEKRKDRFTTRAPYQLNKPVAAPTKLEESNSPAGTEARSSEQLDLNSLSVFGLMTGP